MMTALKPSASQNAAPACNINSSQVSRWILKSNNSPPICKKVVRMALRLNPQEVSDRSKDAVGKEGLQELLAGHFYTRISILLPPE